MSALRSMRRASAFLGVLSVSALSVTGWDQVRAQESPEESQSEAPAAVATDGTVTSPAAASGASPWAATRDVELPAFLDTTDHRIRDDRPAPTPEQVAALLEMEAEVDRFIQAGQGYRGAVNSILGREYAQRRRERDHAYSRQIAEERRLQREARETAIVALERFIRRYPDDEFHTPDAMFRLGELYFDRATDIDDESVQQDLSPTIDLYRDLVARFPNYRRIDGVYYLIGYCLEAMDNHTEALLPWLNLVCANRYQYTGAPPAPPAADEDEAQADSLASHPAASILAPDAPTPAVAAYVDPYTDCTPITEGARFVTEAWMRIGEYHFDHDRDVHHLDLAISAYGHVTSQPEDRYFNLALYKMAWAYYRSSRYVETIAAFEQLVEWSDREAERTGRAGSQVRPEAIRYLGITFAYDDWNENQIPDVAEGQPSTLQRLQDPSLLPQDRPWTVEVYIAAGEVFFESAKYEEAVAVWEYVLEHFPLDHRNPDLARRVAIAYQRMDRRDEQLRISELYTQYLPGTEWYDSNNDHPIEQREAEALAEQILIQQAAFHHEQAQILRRRAVQNRDEALLEQSLHEYNVAASMYRRYLELYPNHPDAYEQQYFLAEAYFFSEQYELAAQAYAGVRDSNLDDRYLSESARRVVDSLQMLMTAASQRGEFAPPGDPEPTGVPPRVVPSQMPDIVQRMAQAREIYLARVDERADTQHLRGAYDFNNALLLYSYGYWPQARERFLRIYAERCSGPNGSEDGQVAYANLRLMAERLGDTEEVGRLARDLLERNCTFAPDGTAPIQRDRAYCQSHPDDLICLAGQDITNEGFRDAVALYQQAQEGTPEGQLCPTTVDDRRRSLFEQAATRMVNAVNESPEHPDAPRALMYAAVALECTSRNESAMRIYTRIIDEVGARRSNDADEQERLTQILAQAYFRLAYSANSNFDYDRAIQNYRILADDRRFAGASLESYRVDAIIGVARIYDYQRNYTQAAEYYRRVAETVSDPAIRRLAYFKVAEMSYRRRDWNGTIREMQSFIDRYRSDAAAGEQVVTATWHIAEARQALNQTRDYQTALQNVVSTFERSGQQPGSMAAEYAAHARFLLNNTEFDGIRSTIRVAPGRQATVEAFIGAIATQIRANGQRIQSSIDAYSAVVAYRRPEWTVASLVQRGQVYEVLASSIINASLTPLPDDLQRAIRGADAGTRDELTLQFQDQVRQALEEQIRPVECLAIVEYAKAARAGRAGALDTEYTRLAITRLQNYGEERIGECITQARAQDAALEAYSPSEFQRARPGRTLSIDGGQAAPSLTGANE